MLHSVLRRLHAHGSSRQTADVCACVGVACRALPGPSEVMSSITMPKTYLTILQDSSMVREKMGRLPQVVSTEPFPKGVAVGPKTFRLTLRRRSDWAFYAWPQKHSVNCRKASWFVPLGGWRGAGMVAHCAC
jgi:hypothetical protein